MRGGWAQGHFSSSNCYTQLLYSPFTKMVSFKEMTKVRSHVTSKEKLSDQLAALE
jgi:hypothetical protein